MYQDIGHAALLTFGGGNPPPMFSACLFFLLFLEEKLLAKSLIFFFSYLSLLENSCSLAIMIFVQVHKPVLFLRPF